MKPTMTLAMLACALWTGTGAAQPSPGSEGETLLAAEKGFAAAAAGTDVVTTLTAMFAPDVIMPGPPGTQHRGMAAVTVSLRANPDNPDGRVEWTPIRAGLSADGQHGFTFGYMTLRKKDSSVVPPKYMSYWVKGASGWRVAGCMRARRPEGEVATTPMPPLLPAALVPANSDAAHVAALRSSLSAAERAFSAEAQQLGLGAAIGRNVGAGAPGPSSPVEWSTDVALVASSGDLGISFGYIRPNGKPPGGAPPNGTPFVTIWHRPSATAPWRYIAE